MNLYVNTLSAVILAVLSADIVFSKTIGHRQLCDNGKFYQFYDRTVEECKRCSKCPKNTVVITPCGLFQDVECGPFADFLKRFNFQQTSEDKSKDNEDQRSHKSTPQNQSTPQVQTSDKAASPFEMSEEWYIIAMVLLGVLSVVAMAIALYIIFACFICKKKATTEKEIVCGTEYVTPIQMEKYMSQCTMKDGHCFTRVLTDDSNMLRSESGNLIFNYNYIEPKDSLLKKCLATKL